MKQIIIAISLLLCILPLCAGFDVVESNETEIILDFHLNTYDIVEDQDFCSIRMEQAGYPETPGAPSLPSFEFKVGIPPSGNAIAKILLDRQEQVTLNKRIKPVPFPESIDGMSHYRYEIDEELYTAPRESIMRNAGVHTFREHPHIPFIIHPFVYDGNNSLNILTYARIKIQIQGNTNNKAAPRNDLMAELFLDQLINKGEAKYWLAPQRSNVNYAEFSKSPWWAKIETDKMGMFRITPSQLSGFSVEDIDPRSFRLFATSGKLMNQNYLTAGEAFTEIPIQVVGEEDGSFDANDYIVFFGSDRTGYENNDALQATDQAIYHNPYSHNGIYWLTHAGSFDGDPLRIRMEDSVEHTEQDSVNTQLYTIHLEEEKHRRSTTGYLWYMSRMFGSSTLDYSFNVNLPDLDTQSFHHLEFRIKPEDASALATHRFSVLINGQIFADNGSVFSWTGNSHYDFSMHTDLFVPGNNQITLRVVRYNTDNLFLDYIRINYTRKLEKGNSQYVVNDQTPYSASSIKYSFRGSMTNLNVYCTSSFSEVSKIEIEPQADGFYFVSRGSENTKFFVCQANELYNPVTVNIFEPTDLSAIEGPIESVIITPPGFMDKAQELANMYLQNWNMKTKVVLQSDIFNQFNGGYPDPMAIKQYLRYLYYNLPEPKIRSLTLLGMGTIDWRNFSGSAASKNHIMIFQHSSNDITSDDYFGMLTNLNHPEIAIGRYPVSNLTELNTMMDNFRRYTQTPKPGLWKNSLLLLADDNVNGTNTMDWQHTRDMQALSNMINPAVFTHKIFAADYDTDEFLNKPRVRDAMFEEINAGKVIWYYIGHGSFDTLSMQNYYTGSTDMGMFKNPDMLPLFVAASCDVSSFDHWAYESLGQKSVLLKNAGAIASVASTRKSFPDPNHGLMSFFIPNLTNSHLPLGAALTKAKTSYTASTNNDAMYIVLGDPNIYTCPPEHSNLILPLVEENIDQTYFSRQTARFSGSFKEMGLAGEAEVIATDSERTYSLGGNTVSQNGNQIFRGKVSVIDSQFDAGMLIPDDIMSGDTGTVLSYLWDENQKEGYISYYHPLRLSDEVLQDTPENDGPPKIEISLGSYDFRPGDKVGTSPVLYARISDDNGINVTGSAGHNILLVLDNSLQPTSVTSYFSYDTDSFTKGTLVYQLPKLSEGNHTIQLIAFDNYNLPEVASTHFIAKESGSISLENFLIYPNPMNKEGYITFIISQSADVTLDVFSISGRRLRRIETIATQGFNKIFFDGKDEFGDNLANNTYFIRIKAKTLDGNSIEKRERLVIYK